MGSLTFPYVIVEVPLDLIDDSPYQTRLSYDEVLIADLAADIKARGVLQPPTGRLVRRSDSTVLLPHNALVTGPSGRPMWAPNQGNVRVQLAFGHTRLRACRAAGITTMPVSLRALDDVAMAEMAWQENEQRSDLSPVEKAHALRRMKDAFGWTDEEVGRHLGLSRSTVTNRLRLLKLPVTVLEMLGDGRTTERKALAALPYYDLPAEDFRLIPSHFATREPAEMLKLLGDSDRTSDVIRYVVSQVLSEIEKARRQGELPNGNSPAEAPTAERPSAARPPATPSPVEGTLPDGYAVAWDGAAAAAGEQPVTATREGRVIGTFDTADEAHEAVAADVATREDDEAVLDVIDAKLSAWVETAPAVTLSMLARLYHRTDTRWMNRPFPGVHAVLCDHVADLLQDAMFLGEEETWANALAWLDVTLADASPESAAALPLPAGHAVELRAGHQEKKSLWHSDVTYDAPWILTAGGESKGYATRAEAVSAAWEKQARLNAPLGGLAEQGYRIDLAGAVERPKRAQRYGRSEATMPRFRLVRPDGSERFFAGDAGALDARDAARYHAEGREYAPALTDRFEAFEGFEWQARRLAECLVYEVSEVIGRFKHEDVHDVEVVRRAEERANTKGVRDRCQSWLRKADRMAKKAGAPPVEAKPAPVPTPATKPVAATDPRQAAFDKARATWQQLRARLAEASKMLPHTVGAVSLGSIITEARALVAVTIEHGDADDEMGRRFRALDRDVDALLDEAIALQKSTTLQAEKATLQVAPQAALQAEEAPAAEASDPDEPMPLGTIKAQLDEIVGGVALGLRRCTYGILQGWTDRLEVLGAELLVHAHAFSPGKEPAVLKVVPALHTEIKERVEAERERRAKEQAEAGGVEA
jgi:ParB/RepB/Spo0J family partition protein